MKQRHEGTLGDNRARNGRFLRHTDGHKQETNEPSWCRHHLLLEGPEVVHCVLRLGAEAEGPRVRAPRACSFPYAPWFRVPRSQWMQQRGHCERPAADRTRL